MLRAFPKKPCGCFSMMNKQVMIALVSLFVLLVGVAVMWRGVDAATDASRDEVLVRYVLPEGLPAVFTAGASGDATGDYEAAIELHEQHKHDLRGKSPPAEVVGKLRSQLVTAAKKATVAQGFLDQRIPLVPGASTEYGDAPTKIASVVLGNLKGLKEVDQVRAARAVFAFGQRIYEENVRISARRAGLMVMTSAGLTLESLLKGAERDAVTQWINSISKLLDKWDEKLKAIHQMAGNAGDLIRFANRDGDLGFRVEAMLQLGMAQYLTDSGNNRRAIRNALSDNVNSPEPMLAKAATAALNFTREQVRQVR
jgi:hypothetical protein